MVLNSYNSCRVQPYIPHDVVEANTAHEIVDNLAMCWPPPFVPWESEQI